VSDTVLIADSNGERGQRVATACRARAVDTHVVNHGAAALEFALAEQPRAMVAQLELPLIDGARLAEILQANPRTRSMGILFVGEPGAEGRAGGRNTGRVLPGHADPETIARFIEALLEKRRPEPVARPAGEDTPGVEGKLSQISLPELIELFHVNRKTGVIEVRHGGGRRPETGRIHLRDGDVLQARTGSVEGEKALYRLLAWRRGTFAFREDLVPDRAVIDRPTRALLREAQRQSREWERLAVELPPAHARVALTVSRSSLPNVLHPLTQEVLLVLELSERVQDVLDRCSFPDYQVLRTLQTLARRGMVQLRSDASSTDPTVGGGLFAPALAARLRDWLDQGRARDAGPVDAKVVVVASAPEALRAFGALASRLPGAEVAPAPTAPGIWPLLRLPVDEEIAIELFDVPPSSRFAPVWPLAAHGALATLFLHGGPVEASIGALRASIDEMTGLPRARCFHLLLEGKDRSRVDTLCERLGLFDDRCVLAVAQEHPDVTAGGLRDLLSRILP